MAISQELRNQIRRMYYADHIKINGICETLSIHPDTVKNAINYQKFVRKESAKPYWDEFKSVIEGKLELYPKLTSTRLHQILLDRGASGSVGSLRCYVKGIRPHIREAFVKRAPMPADEGQVDWAHFGTMTVGDAERKLYCFVMILSWSRQAFAKFTFDLKTETFLACHVEAFKFFRGTPRVILYDNLKSVVLERQGASIRYNPAALEFFGHYYYEARPCNVRRGNEKGIVERKIRFIRDNFFAARELSDIDTLNCELNEWLDTTANRGRWPDNRDFRINDKFLEEQPKLLALPPNHLQPEVEKVVQAGKYAHIRFDLNTYSIPWQYVQRSLSVLANQKRLRIYSEGVLIAEHERSWDKGLEIYIKSHHEDLKVYKKRLTLGLLKDGLLEEVPEVDPILRSSADRAEPLRKTITHLRRLQSTYGHERFVEAVKQANTGKHYSAESVEVILRQKESQQITPPSLTLRLPANRKVQDLNIKSHELSTYDDL